MAQGRADTNPGTTGPPIPEATANTPLFVTLALNAVERGQHVRAAIRALEGVQRYQGILHSPSDDPLRRTVMDVLARAVQGPGLENELLDVEHVFPGFIDELFEQIEETENAAALPGVRRAMAMVVRERGEYAFDVDSNPELQAALQPGPSASTAEGAPIPKLVPEDDDPWSAPVPETQVPEVAAPHLEAAPPSEPAPGPDPTRETGAPVSSILDEIDVRQLADHGATASSPPRSYLPDGTGLRFASLTTSDRDSIGDLIDGPAPQTRSAQETGRSSGTHADPRIVPRRLSEKWLSERLSEVGVGAAEADASEDAPERGPSTHHADAASDDSNRERDSITPLFGVEADSRALRLGRMASADDLLSHAVAAADDEARSRRQRTHGALESRLGGGRRRLSIGLLVLVLVSAAAALAPLAWDTLSSTWQQGSVEVASRHMQRASRSGLLEARAILTRELAERPHQTDAPAGLALLADTLLATRFDIPRVLPVVSADGALVDEDSHARAAAALGALANDDVGGARALYAQDAERPAPLDAWIRGLIAEAEGRTTDAARLLARAARDRQVGGLALTDLAQLALRHRDTPVVSVFFDAAKERSSQPFVALAARLLRTDPLEIDESRLLPSLLPPAELSDGQRVWYYVAAGYQALGSGDVEAARAAVASGSELSTGHGQLQFLDGIVALRAGDLEAAEQSLSAGTRALGSMAQSRRLRAEIAGLVSEAGRPDILLRVLQYEASEPLDAVVERLTPSTAALLTDALLSLGRHDEALGLLTHPRLATHEAFVARRAMLSVTRPDLALSAVASGEGTSVFALFDAVEHGRFEDAVEQAAQYAATDPTSSVAVRVRAELLSIQGLGEDAARIVTAHGAGRLVDLRSTILATLYRSRIGTASTEAADAATSALVTDIDLLLAQAEIASLHDMQSRARERLERAEFMAPRHPRLLALEGVHLERGHDERRLAMLRNGRQGHLSVPGLYETLGSVHAARGEVDAAFAAYELAMQRPAADRAVESAAALFDTSKLRRRGRRLFKELFETTPATPATRTLRGEIAYELAMMYRPESGHYEAARNLKRARVLLGEQARIMFHMAEYFAANDMDRVAEKYYEKAKAIEAAGDAPIN